MNLVGILIAPVLISESLTQSTRIIVVIVSLIALAASVFFSKRESPADDKAAIEEATRGLAVTPH